jgi:hypothetical protein
LKIFLSWTIVHPKPSAGYKGQVRNIKPSGAVAGDAACQRSRQIQRCDEPPTPDLSIEEIAERFSDFRVALLIAETLVAPLRGPAVSPAMT